MELRWLASPRLRARVIRVISFPAVDVGIALLIFVSIASLVLERYYEDDPVIVAKLAIVEATISVIFAIELSIRFAIAKHKRRFLWKYWPDLLAILPAFRIFRFLWILRVLRLFRLGLILSRRVGVLRDVFRINVYEFWVLAVLSGLLIAGATVTAFSFEGQTNPEFSTLGKSFWWALDSIIAGEPIGSVPTTNVGRILLVVMMLGGSTIFAAVTGVVSATMVGRLSGRKELFDMDIDELESHIVVCGWNAGVPALITEIVRDARLQGLPIVFVNDHDAPFDDLRRTGVRKELVYHLRGDHARFDVLKRAGIERASRAVVMADAQLTQGTDRDARSVLAALTIEKINPQIHCTVELMDEANESHLRVAGVEAIVMRNDLAGRVLAIGLRDGTLSKVLMDLSTLTFGQTMQRLSGPEKATSFADLLSDRKRGHGELVIGIERDGALELNPAADFRVQPSDWLIAIDLATKVR